jgi:hypothetical protein
MMAEPDDTSALIVHGTYELRPGLSGIRDVHGWFEKDGMCWDWQTHGCTPAGRSRYKVTSTTPPPVPRDEFYRRRGIEVRQSFTREQMGKAMLAAGHWGPWFDEKCGS